MIPFNDEGLTWFSDSPDAGTPECKCSLCGEMIDGVPVRISDTKKNKEIRLHQKCFQKRLPP